MLDRAGAGERDASNFSRARGHRAVEALRAAGAGPRGARVPGTGAAPDGHPVLEGSPGRPVARSAARRRTARLM